MKKILNIFSVAVLVLMAVSCDRKVEYQHETFATFYTNAYNVNEDCGTLKVPVVLYNPTGAEAQFALTVNADKAEEGKDFEIISPANGILTFSEKTDSLTVEIAISDDFVGEFTGGKHFTLQLASITDGIKVGNFNAASVDILDLDHPLAAFIGTWSGTVNALFQNPSYKATITIVADEKDETFTKLVVNSGLDPFFTSMGYGKDKKYEAIAVSSTEIAVTAEQENGYDDVVLLGFNDADPDAATAYDHIRFVVQDDGSLKLTTAYGAYTPSGGGFYEIYLGGAILTRQ